MGCREVASTSTLASYLSRDFRHLSHYQKLIVISLLANGRSLGQIYKNEEDSSSINTARNAR